jgi:predicted metal-dependent hydrolase
MAVRLLPDVPLPPYAFVPGRTPHPVSDPAGHQYGVEPQAPPPLDPERWRDSRAYLRGVDLFNHGYYWEAHEAWEGLWLAAGRAGPLADFLKGLIQLAAAGVKAREGLPRGVAGHAARAAELFGQTARSLGGASYLGLTPAELLAAARRVEQQAPAMPGDPDASVKVVFDFLLMPSDR